MENIQETNNQRAIFPSGMQRAFLKNIETRLTTQKIADLCSRSARTIRDWRREKFSMPRTSIEILSEYTGVAMPEVDWKDEYVHASEAGKRGYTAVIEKYGNMPKDEDFRESGLARMVGYKGKIPRPPHSLYAQADT